MLIDLDDIITYRELPDDDAVEQMAILIRWAGGIVEPLAVVGVGTSKYRLVDGLYRLAGADYIRKHTGESIKIPIRVVK